MFELTEPVTICDQFSFLILLQPEHEIGWKSVAVACDLLVQLLGRRSVNSRKLRVDDDSLPTQPENQGLDYGNWFCGLGWLRNSILTTGN